MSRIVEIKIFIFLFKQIISYNYRNTTIIACPINHDLSPHGLNSSIFVLGFLPLSSISELTTETRLPLFAIAENLIDFKNYSISGIEYTLHHAETKSGKGVQVASLSCFEKLWQMFKTFGHRRIISLETDVKGFLPTASVFGKVKLV